MHTMSACNRMCRKIIVPGPANRNFCNFLYNPVFQIATRSIHYSNGITDGYDLTQEYYCLDKMAFGHPTKASLSGFLVRV